MRGQRCARGGRISHIEYAALVGVQAVIALGLMVATYQAKRRTGDARLWFLSLAFLVFFVEGVVVVASLAWGWIGHDGLEVVEAAFDSVAMALLAAPLFLRR